MNQLIRAEELVSRLIKQPPLLDVRSESEFIKGTLPGASNLPLLNDAEREAIGKCYEQSGQQAAIDLGHQLVNGDEKLALVQRWKNYLTQNPDALLFCFRGGLRSQIAQQWLAEAGCKIPRIAGGYKAVRRLLLNTIEQASKSLEFLLIAGKTGCGKTLLLEHFDNQIDLEGLANHRGSAFGNRTTDQPGQIDFENQLALALMKLPYTSYHRLILEDESRAIGSLSIPIVFSRRMSESPIAVVEHDKSYRVDTILNAYIVTNYQEFSAVNADTAQQKFTDYLFGSLQRIKKRLGATLFDEVSADMREAVLLHHKTGEISAHKIWIEKLLTHYYDPMYDYQLNKKLSRIVFRGSREEFHQWSCNLQSLKKSDTANVN